MFYDEKAKKILKEQMIRCEDNDRILTPIVKESDSLFRIVVDAYNLGVINGKQAERARRAHI